MEYSTVLGCAVYNKKWDLVPYLIKHGVNLKIDVDHDHVKILHLAAHEKNWNLVNYLIVEGHFSINSKNYHKETVIHYAAR